MKEQEIDNHQLAIRYFEGRVSPSEEETLFRFVDATPENKKSFRRWEENGCFPVNLSRKFPMNGDSYNAGCRYVSH